VPLTSPSKLELDSIRDLAEFRDLRVLEIGAGDGRLSWPFAAEAACWITLDPDVDEVRLAMKDLRALDETEGPVPTARLSVGDARRLSFPDEYFDVAFFTWSLC
jgi:ubiquinone/menaquinone biosynthesis C-methylase UbiE